MTDGLLVGACWSGLKLGTAAEACDGNGNCARVGDVDDELCRDDCVDGNRSEDMEFGLLSGARNCAGRLPLDPAGASCLILRGEPPSDGDGDDAPGAGESFGDSKALISIASHSGPQKTHPPLRVELHLDPGPADGRRLLDP